MKRKQLLFLLALLMTAATGAWAQSAKHLITATLNEKTLSLEQPLPYATTIGELYEAVTGESFDQFVDAMSSEYGFNGIGSNNTGVVSIGDYVGASTTVTVNDDGNASVRIMFSGFAQDINLSVVHPLYVTMADGTADADKWKATVGTNSNAKTLPVGGLNRGEAVTLNYSGRLKVKSVTATHDGWNGDLSSIPASALEADGQTLIVDNGMTLKGRLDVSTIQYRVVIPDDATVTLAGVIINPNSVNDPAYKHAGITCEGDATIILADGSDNSVKGFFNSFPGIQPGPATTTLTITGEEKGTGKLTASSNGWGAGIGAGHKDDISECGNILIKGGIITAIGSNDAAAIGSGQGTKCGDITITNGVTKVTAKKEFSATYRIGPGDNGGTCGTVTIGGTVYWQDNAAKSADADAYLKQAEIVYPDPLATPLTIEALTAGTIKVDMGEGTLETGLQYSVNGGTKYEIKKTSNITVAKGDKVQFYGNGIDVSGDDTEVRIQGSGDGFQTKVYGNIMSLLDEEGFATKTELPNANVFYQLFYGNTTLIDASELLLPAATLTNGCYHSMFMDCTNLTTAPKLPATTLATSCYECMFLGCTSLTTAPKLPATTLATSCYVTMFMGCSSLTNAYVKAAFTADDEECAYMFDECTATGATLHTTSGSMDSWQTKMGTGKDWDNWSVAGDWQD